MMFDTSGVWNALLTAISVDGSPLTDSRDIFLTVPGGCDWPVTCRGSTLHNRIQRPWEALASSPAVSLKSVAVYGPTNGGQSGPSIGHFGNPEETSSLQTYCFSVRFQRRERRSSWGIQNEGDMLLLYRLNKALMFTAPRHHPEKKKIIALLCSSVKLTSAFYWTGTSWKLDT